MPERDSNPGNPDFMEGDLATELRWQPQWSGQIPTPRGRGADAWKSMFTL